MAPSGDSVALALADGQEHVVVDERQDKVVWRGDASSAHIPVRPGSSAKLTVAAVSDDGVQPVGTVLTSNPSPQSRQTPVIAVTTPSGTQLGWGGIPGATDYRVLTGPANATRQTAAMTQPTTNVPTTLGQHGRYEVLSNDIPQPDPNPDDQQAPGPVTYRYGVEVTPPNTDLAAMKSDVQVGDPVPAQPSGIVSTNNSYETYIPDKYIDAPEDPLGLTCDGSFFGPDWWYNGNNRQTAYHTGNYKTAVDYTMQWPSKRTDVFSDVSSTNRYERRDDGSFAYDSTRHAGSDLLLPNRQGNDGRRADNFTSHEVGNPFCNSLASITYANDQETYQDGGHVISGNHDKMPNHQFYRQDMVRTDPTNPNSPARPRLQLVFNHPYASPTCLFSPTPGCGLWEYQYVR